LELNVKRDVFPVLFFFQKSKRNRGTGKMPPQKWILVQGIECVSKRFDKKHGTGWGRGEVCVCI
jgi:hypothetical protein